MSRLIGVGLLGCVTGILLYSYVHLGWQGIVWCVLTSTVLVVVYAGTRNTTYLIVAVFLLTMGLGALRVHMVPHDVPPLFGTQVGTKVTYEGVVIADPDIREETVRVVMRVEEEGVVTNVLVVAPLFPSIRYGETIRATGVLERPEPFQTSNGRVFQYDEFLRKDGVFTVIPRAEVEVVRDREGIGTIARGVLSDVKANGIHALGEALPEPQASLASGLILGGKQGLGEELLDDFIRVGLIHIVVLSGYNVMIVAEFVMRLFGFLSRRWAAVAGVITIGAFVLAAGAGPASIRAGIMAGIALFGRATGRTYDAFRALLAAGFLMLLVNPPTLAFDPGFQLSFIATLGLIFGAPLIEKWFTWMKSAFLREIVGATVSAQVAVLPLLLYQSGLFSLVALPANLLVLPLVPLTMLFSFIALLAGALVPLAAPVLGLPALLLLSYITTTVKVMAALPLAAITLPAFPFLLVIATYLLLGVFVLRAATLRPRENAFR